MRQITPRRETLPTAQADDTIGVNVLMAVGSGVEKFIRPEKMEELESMVNLTIRNGMPRDEAIYSSTLQETQAQIVITGWGSPRLTVRALEENPQLEYMCHLTGTVRHFIEREALEMGLLVTNWGNLVGPTVAEGALVGILSCLRRTTEVDFLMHRDKGWRGRQEESLFHQRVGLHGFGTIAQNLVKLLQPFQCEISTYSPHAPDEVLAQYRVGRVTDLKTLYAGNHIISIHASNTPENYHIVNADVLTAMEDGAILVNTARGAIVDTDALVTELKTGRIYASLDVYEKEPLPEDSPLRGLLNCHLTCHTAGPTEDRMVDMGDGAIENIRRYIQGEPVERVVDLQKYDLIT